MEMEIESQSNSQEVSKGTTFFRTCFNAINALSGVGILSVPYALSKGGWLSLTLLLLVPIICFFTGLLLHRCLDYDPQSRTFPDIGELAFGRIGRIIISTFMYLELFLVAVEFLILEGDNLHKLFPIEGFTIGVLHIGGKQTLVLVTALFVLPTTWLNNLGWLAYFSAGGVLASVILVLSVFSVGAFNGVGFRESGNLWNWNGIPTAIGLYTFCFCGHPVFPTLRNSMQDRSQFPKVLIVSFISSTISYGSMGIIGYLMYGQNLLSQVTLNLPTRKISTITAICTTLINPITKYGMIVAPISTAIEEAFHFENNRPRSLLIRTILVIITVIVALIVPFFGYIMAFIGSFLNVGVSLLFPCLCYLKINRDARRFGSELIGIGVILVFGVIVAVVGTLTSVRDIVEHV